ncbi:lantibiotic dehydratase [Chryseobacterium sp.]|uniref:lantibiotic dehydratase n=1 Tax=Chryseobacterium sp. TaxID=1871047 RepID=UPI00289B56F0|nr:lantibiotic dehydratase [Chryseobacterium sp.]
MQKYETYNKYVIRKPLFSYDILFNNNETKNIEEVVNEMIDNDDFVTSIYWSSPDLYETISAYKQKLLSQDKINRLFHTLKKYVIRISTRPTPYGTMAGVALKDLQSEEKPVLKARKARIDMDFLSELKSHIENNEFIRPHLKYKANNTLIKLHGQYRYQEPTHKEGEEKYQLTSLESNEFLDQLYELSEYEEYNEIKNIFPSSFENEEISSFLEELIDIKFLVSELQSTLTSDTAKKIKNTLQILFNKGISETKIYLDILNKIENCTCILENTPINYLPEAEINDIKNLAKTLEIEKTHIFHVDLQHNLESNFELTNQKLKNIAHAVSILHQFGSYNSAYGELETFKQIFNSKYESNEVPLLEVLDTEFGIGFPANSQIGNIQGNSLLEGLGKTKDTSAKNRESSKLDLLLDLIEENNFSRISLEDHDWGTLETAPIQSRSFHIAGFPYKEGFFLQNIGTLGANNILGRFGLFDEKIKKFCDEILQQEQENKDIIFAEVVFAPEKRIANIARRPKLSEYEIPIFAENNDETKTILLQDIMVSVYRDKIILRSKKLNKRIIPRLSNAHNFYTSENAIYRFLSTLQSSEHYNIHLNFNYSTLKKRFIPRIVFKDIILHRASWILHENDIKKIKTSENPLQALKFFLQKWNVEKYIALIQSDNELFLDTSNDSYLLLLLEELKNNKLIQLSEWLGAVNGEKNFIEQILLPLKNVNFSSETSVQIQNKTIIQRSFAPGSEWLYLKIYCNSNISDHILSDLIFPVLNELVGSNLMKSSFFIRYTDPHYHIRLRIELSDTKYYSEVLQKLYTVLNPYFQEQMIWNLQLDSYHRELERYLPEHIEATETAFYYDSILIFQLLNHESFRETEEMRLFAAVKNIDKWLSVFRFSSKEKLEFCQEIEDSFSKEFGSELKRHIASKYRILNEDLNNFLKESIFEEEFNARDKNISQLILCKENLSSYIHMSINRWFSSEQRALEFMSYSFAVKYYKRILSQAK